MNRIPLQISFLIQFAILCTSAVHSETLVGANLNSTCANFAYYVLLAHGDWKEIYIKEVTKEKKGISIKFYDEYLNYKEVSTEFQESDCDRAYEEPLGKVLQKGKVVLDRDNCFRWLSVELPAKPQIIQKFEDVTWEEVIRSAPFELIKRKHPTSFEKLDTACFPELIGKGAFSLTVVLDDRTGHVKALIDTTIAVPIGEATFVNLMRLLKSIEYETKGKESLISLIFNFKS